MVDILVMGPVDIRERETVDSLGQKTVDNPVRVQVDILGMEMVDIREWGRVDNWAKVLEDI